MSKKQGLVKFENAVNRIPYIRDFYQEFVKRLMEKHNKDT